jgi:hypothetical protein
MSAMTVRAAAAADEGQGPQRAVLVGQSSLGKRPGSSHSGPRTFIGATDGAPEADREFCVRLGTLGLLCSVRLSACFSCNSLWCASCSARIELRSSRNQMGASLFRRSTDLSFRCCAVHVWQQCQSCTAAHDEPLKVLCGWLLHCKCFVVILCGLFSQYSRVSGLFM